MGVFDSRRDAWERLAEWAKEQEDRALGWDHDEVKRLKIKVGDFTSPEFYAEVQHLPPAFGFAAARPRAKVRIRIDIRVMDPLPERGISLYEGDRPFGKENGWSVETWCIHDERPGYVDFFLET
jgi:hypothetical protein